MLIPLLSSWTISGDALPERLRPQDMPEPAFHLPGADALAEYADLIGSAPADTPADAPLSAAPFALPSLIPGDACGGITLTREVDFAALRGDAAWLSFDMLCGQGVLTLKSLPPRFIRAGAPGAEEITLTAAFDNQPLSLDVTSALRAHRRFTLTLRFDGSRPAGVCGAVLLRTADSAELQNVTIEPDAHSGTLTIAADVHAFVPGGYTLRAQFCPPQAPSSQEDALPAREITLNLSAGETKSIKLGMEAVCSTFCPGKVYAAPSIKLLLFKTASSRAGMPCDGVTLMCGFPGPSPSSWLALEQNDLRLPPEHLLQEIQALHADGVSLPAPAPDMLYRLLTRAGVGVRHSRLMPMEAVAALRRYPCVTFDAVLPPADPADASFALNAWRLCGLVTYARPAEPGVSDAELLRDAAGREVNPRSPDVQAVLVWLRAFSIRLRAEAIRQGKLTGALCAPGEFHQPDVAQAIGTALAPIHLSALPLCGAWWTGSHFSAALAAFIPKDALSVDKSVRAEAVLEDAEGHVIARTEFPCAPWRSGLSLLEATLPGSACVLELITRLYADDEVIEESSMPVYVGERGMLEAAF